MAHYNSKDHSSRDNYLRDAGWMRERDVRGIHYGSTVSIPASAWGANSGSVSAVRPSRVTVVQSRPGSSVLGTLAVAAVGAALVWLAAQGKKPQAETNAAPPRAASVA